MCRQGLILVKDLHSCSLCAGFLEDAKEALSAWAFMPRNLRVRKNEGYHIGAPHNKDYSIFGVHIRVRLFWETTICKRVVLPV